MSSTHSTTQKAPTITQTGLGYRYVRDQSGDRDVSLYLHQLAAIAGGADPHNVFSDAFDIHHKPVSDWLDLEAYVGPTPVQSDDGVLVPPLDVPAGVEPAPRWQHRQENFNRGGD